MQKSEEESISCSPHHSSSIVRTKEREMQEASLKTDSANKPHISIYQKNYPHNKTGFISEMQRWFNIHKSISLINSVSELKDKNHMNHFNRCRKGL